MLMLAYRQMDLEDIDVSSNGARLPWKYGEEKG